MLPYNPTNWKTGDMITSEKLNKLENGVADKDMRYEPTNWQTGDIITAQKLNKLQQGAAASSGVDLVISPSCTSISNYTFYGNTDLQLVELPNVRTVGQSAFNASLIRQVTLPAVKTIQSLAFAYCHNLEKVTIGSSCQSIANDAFQDAGATVPCQIICQFDPNSALAEGAPWGAFNAIITFNNEQ